MTIDQDQTSTVTHAWVTRPMPVVPQQKKLSWKRRIFSVIAGILVALFCVGGTAALYYKDGVPTQVNLIKKQDVNWPHGVPIGITLSGLQNFIMQPSVITTLDKQAWAAKNYWHANTIRFQILQDRLVGSHGDLYAPYYMRYIKAVVNYSLHLGLTVVLNAQTELSIGYSKSEPLPDYATMVFWDKIMKVKRYRNNPRVVLDLFNEPRYCSWGEWQDAHQHLINHLRGEGVKNTFWVEGRWWGSTLEGVPLLKGGNLVYTFHHPGAPWPDQAPVSKATWDKAFGYLADQGVKVVDGEFANFTGSYDWQDPYIPGYFKPGVLVRQYLRYLRAHHIGMLAWSLLPGSLNKTADYHSVSKEPQGDGALVMDWFHRVHKANVRMRS